jgi:NAD(P)H-hydrate epimerase
VRAVLTADEIRSAEARFVAGGGASVPELMERAGTGAARRIESLFGSRNRVSVFCGSGHNGGDGMIVARELRSEWTRVFVFAERDLRGEPAARLAELRARRRGPRIVMVPSAEAWVAAREEATRSTLVVDALLGTGSAGEPRELASAAIAGMRALRSAGARVVSLDLPSGTEADSAHLPPWPCVEADVTLAFAAAKPCLILSPACDAAGQVEVVTIGIPQEALLSGSGPVLDVIDESALAVAFPPRPAESHKGTFGHVLIVAGSVGKSGAAVLAARAAFRAGAGLVTVASVNAVADVIAASVPEAMTVRLDGADELSGRPAMIDRLFAEAEGKSAILVGPGLGRTRDPQGFIPDFAVRVNAPLVLDADAIHLLGPAVRTRLRSRSEPAFLTPHPGEMGSLLGLPARDVQADRLRRAREAAAELGSYVALKGRRTLVAAPDGRAGVNVVEHPALATAGSGDVLAGVVAAIAARGVEPYTALRAAVLVHGLAGKTLGVRRPWGVVASDLIEALPRTIARATRRRRRA